MGLELGNSNAKRGNSQTNKGEYYQKPMKELIVNNSERFRLEIKGKLKYAKGKINLDLNNNIKDGRGISLYEHQKPGVYGRWKNFSTKFIYAFYEDGFYEKRKDSSYQKYEIEKLSDFIPDYAQFREGPAKFKGGYTDNNKKVETIEDIYDYTDLFKYKENNDLPEITLHAHGEGVTFRVRVHNLRSRRATSSVEYNGEINEKSIIGSFKVIYNTDIIAYINERIKNPKYVTGAYDKLDGTAYSQALRDGPQKFLCGAVNGGYYSDENSPFLERVWYSGYFGPDKNFFATGRGRPDLVGYEEITYDVYPVFEFLIIGPRTKLPRSGAIKGGFFKTYNTKSPYAGENIVTYITGENENKDGIIDIGPDGNDFYQGYPKQGDGFNGSTTPYEVYNSYGNYSSTLVLELRKI